MDHFTLSIQSEADVFLAVSRLRRLIQGRFTEAEQQAAFVTVLELGRNVIVHAFGLGTIHCELDDKDLRIQVRDQGPGILNLQEILDGRYRSPTGLGLGLLGATRLMDDFYIRTSAGGTDILAVKRPAYFR